jgi:hypothetical protein
VAIRKCSECEELLVYPDGTPKPDVTKTHSKSCRSKRAARIKRAKKARAAAGNSPYAPELQEAVAAAAGKVKDAAHDVMVDELRPMVREAMTADVLRGIDKMVKLTPKAIELLEEQLASEDETIAQRAATLLLKYTMGNPSVAPPPTQQAPSPMTVQFNIPRPGDATTPELALPEDDTPVELRECTDCGEHKAAHEFVGASPRCQLCFDALHATLQERFAVADDTAP